MMQQAVMVVPTKAEVEHHHQRALESYKRSRFLHIKIDLRKSEVKWTISAMFVDEGDQQRHKLSAQLSALLSEQAKLTQQLLSSDSTLDEHLSLYSIVSCQHLCDRLYTLLPSELREKVYANVLEEQHIKVYGHVKQWKGYKVAVAYFHPRPVSKYDYHGNLHFWDVNIVGRGMQKELAATWYRVSVFYLDTDTHLVSRFLLEDRWNLGLSPRQLVRRVVVVIYPDSSRWPWVWKFANVGPKLIEDLRRLEKPSKVCIAFQIHNHLGWLDLWRRHVEAAQSIVGVLSTARNGLWSLLPLFRPLQTVGHDLYISAPGWHRFSRLYLELSDNEFQEKYWTVTIHILGLQERSNLHRQDMCEAFQALQ